MTVKIEEALGLSYGAALGETPWNVWMDANLVKIGATAQISVVNMTTTTPPAIVEGERYIVAAGASGAWAAKDGQLAVAVDSSWQFYALKRGWLIEDQSDGYIYKWNGATFDRQATAADLANKQANLQFKEEGSNLGTAGTVSSIDFVGTGVTASRVGDAITVTIGGGGAGVTWQSPKLITVGTGGDYPNILAAQTAMANYAGLILQVTMLDDLTSASPVVVSFPTYAYAEINLNGKTVGANILSITGGKDFGAISGSGTLNNSSLTLDRLVTPFVGASGTLTLAANATFRNCDLNTLTLAGTQTALFDYTNDINSVNTTCILYGVSGSHHFGVVSANYAADPSTAIIAGGGASVYVGSYTNSGASVSTVYYVTGGTIFGAAPAGNFSTANSQTANTVTANGIIFA